MNGHFLGPPHPFLWFWLWLRLLLISLRHIYQQEVIKFLQNWGQTLWSDTHNLLTVLFENRIVFSVERICYHLLTRRTLIFIVIIIDACHGYQLQKDIKVFTVHAMKAYKRRRGIAPLILQVGTRWRSVVNIMSQPL